MNYTLITNGKLQKGHIHHKKCFLKQIYVFGLYFNNIDRE